jgi:DNA transformation protein
VIDEAAVRELFSPAGPVSIRRMFGGFGIYRQGRIIALAVADDVWLKADVETRRLFKEAGAEPFTYATKAGERTVTSYWRMPAECHEDEDELRRWVALAEQASLRGGSVGKPERARK